MLFTRPIPALPAKGIPPGRTERGCMIALDHTATGVSAAIATTSALWGIGIASWVADISNPDLPSLAGGSAVNIMVTVPLICAVFSYAVERAHIAFRTSAQMLTTDRDPNQRLAIRERLAEANSFRSRIPVLALSFAAMNCGGVEGSLHGGGLIRSLADGHFGGAADTAAMIVGGIGGFAAVWSLTATRAEQHFNTIAARRLNVTPLPLPAP